MADETKDPLREAFRQHAEWARESALAEERRASKPDCGHEEWIAHRERAKAYRDCESMARAALSAPTTDRFDCLRCGPGVKADEEWCCVHCGHSCLVVRNGVPDYANVADELREEYEPSAPAPEPQGWEERGRGMEEAAEILIDCWDDGDQGPPRSEIEQYAEIVLLRSRARALRASVSGTGKEPRDG